ncbi:hypothetical protein [Streptomyces sp. NBC_01803]|uniref:hypothetical protein n=1 Tax=Streptomyces sp. NBC_01803 TaxID=2975946 RepID=UPI002DD84E0F|nr:hypothetical protein [Streptomyces sp. NBC_01803]WSA46732.1 hypothetical protein OIE51_22635 [Streptomyces sp. NBC_01803]
MPTHRVEVWRVFMDPPRGRKKDRFEPYFCAWCSCGWVGTAYDVEPDRVQAERASRTEAHTHDSNVVAGVIDIPC